MDTSTMNSNVDSVTPLIICSKGVVLTTKVPNLRRVKIILPISQSKLKKIGLKIISAVIIKPVKTKLIPMIGFKKAPVDSSKPTLLIVAWTKELSRIRTGM